MSSYWAKRRRILKGVERDRQEIAAANNALLAVIPDFDRVNPPVYERGMATTSHGPTLTPEAQEITVDRVYESGEFSSSKDGEEDCLRTQLSEWAIDNTIPHVALGQLLTILSKDHPTLPKPMRFAIVQFMDEEDLPFAVVPQVWLSEGMCYWPPFNLRKKEKVNNLAVRCTPPHSTWEKHHFKFMKGAESWQDAMRYLVRFQTGSSIETTDDDKKGKRKRISNSKCRPQASSDEEESSLPHAPAKPLLSFKNIVPSNKFSALPDASEVASISEIQENWEPSVDFRVEPGFSPVIQTHRAKSLSTNFQRLQNENQALRMEKQFLRMERQALREESQALRESNARAASDGSGSLQEQLKQVGTMLMTFARTGQSGADQTLMLRLLEEFGDVLRSMDNKMDTMLQHISANVCVG